MFCGCCGYGSSALTRHWEDNCPQCGVRGLWLSESRFPDKPKGKGSGHPNGKTARTRQFAALRAQKAAS